MMEIIEKCMRSSDLSGLHALQSMWDNQDPSVFASDRLLKSKKSLLMTASKLGHLECCKFLLSIETPNINTRYHFHSVYFSSRSSANSWNSSIESSSFRNFNVNTSAKL